MSFRFMLDTDTVSFALRGVGEVGAQLLRQRPSEVCISALTLAELRFGADHRRSARLHALIDAFCKGVSVVPFEANAAAQCGKVGTSLLRRGLPIGQLDTLIAAHALVLNVTLVTNNSKHFSKVHGLRIENWL